MSVNTQLTGHGIGKRFQQPPFIVHHGPSVAPVTSLCSYRPENHDTTPMQLGDCFTIEPILVQGRESRGFVWDDGWTMSSEVRHPQPAIARLMLIIEEERRKECPIRTSSLDHGQWGGSSYCCTMR